MTRLSPQVVLLEADLADRLGVDSVKSFKDACPDVTVIVISAGDRGGVVPESFASSASDLLPEDSNGDDVVSALLQAFSGGSVIDPEIFGDPGPGQPSQDDSYMLHLGSLSMIRLNRYHVLISRRRACPRCYERKVVKWGSFMPHRNYECSGCGVNFVGASLAGLRIGIAERMSPRDQRD